MNNMWKNSKKGVKMNIKSFVNKYKEFIDNISIILIVCVYIQIKFLLERVNADYTLFISIENVMTLDRSAICGILTQIQMMIIVCLTIWYGTKGYIIALILCTITIGGHFIPLLVGQEIISVIGLIMIVTAGILATIVQIYSTFLNQQKRQLNELANFDSLTGLINRRTILNELEMLSEAKDDFTIVFIDIDDFKKVNDIAGHHQGDLFLQEVAATWVNIIVKGDLLGRIGGDEFALIIKRSITNDEIRVYIQKLKDALRAHVHLGHSHQHVTASFGVSRYPKDSYTANHLLQYADAAMYAAKTSGKNDVQFFSKDMYEKMMYTMQLENALGCAIENDELYLMYQPQYECCTKRLRGFEVLLRWKSKTFGFISPAEFIPLSEKIGDIVDIGEWALETACRRFKALLDTYHTKKILSVNISVLQLLEPNFIEMVKKVIEKTGFDPNYLEFEITESVFISSKDYIIGILQQLRAMGIHIALDDFGTHYASLSYIQMLPLDILKIDKSFIDHILDKEHKTNLVGAIIAIAQELNYKVVAEGIEKDEQIQYLNEKGCDYVQGYLWGKPLVEEDVEALLKKLMH